MLPSARSIRTGRRPGHGADTEGKFPGRLAETAGPLFIWLALEANSLCETLARWSVHVVSHKAATSSHHRRPAAGASNATCRRGCLRDGR